MNITVVGGGNIGTQFAVHCAEKSNEVIIYTSRPKDFNSCLTIVNKKGKTIHEGIIKKATSNDKEAFENADLIFITLPAYCMEEISKKIYPYIKKGQIICLVPGTGGGECCFKKHIERGIIVCGLQRVPSVARLVEYGKTVKAVGYRDELFVASLPYNKNITCKKIIENIFDIKCKSLPNYLNLTLTPSNPILHTTRLRKIFENYHNDTVYEKLPLFYENWDNATSELLFKCDNEVQNICKELHNFDLSYVKSLKNHYESYTVQELTNKISNIEGFKGLKTPSIRVENGFIPDLNSRYFTADFLYGLTILIQIADFYSINVKNLKETLNWYLNIDDTKKMFDYTNYDIFNKQDFEKFYCL